MSTCTRRFVLQSGVAAALGLVMAPSSARAVGVARAGLAGQLPSTPPTPLAPWQPATPLALTQSSNLSEDYYTSSDVLLDPVNLGGFVAPVVRSDGTQVLLTQCSGQLSLVAPSTATATGYAITPVTGLPGSLLYPTAAAGQSGSVLICGFTTDNDQGVPWAATVDADGTTTGRTQLRVWGGNPGSGYPQHSTMSAAVDPASGQARFVYAATADNSTWQLCLYDPGTLAQSASPIPLPEGTGVIDALFTAWSVGDQILAAGLAQLDDGSLFFIRAVVGEEVQGARLTTSGGSLIKGNVGAGACPLAVSPVDGGLVTVSYNDPTDYAYVAVCNAKGVLVTPAARLLDNRAYGGTVSLARTVQTFYDPVSKFVTAYVLDDYGTAYVQQLDFSQPNPANSPGVPLQAGVSSMYLPARAPQSETVLALTFPPDAADLRGLNPVTLISRPDATSAWLLTPLKADAANHIPMPTWRTMLTVTDPAGLPVTSHPVYVTPAADVISYAPGGAVALPANVTKELYTDSHGQICIASLATSLNATALSVGLLNQPTQPVAPDAEVHNFLAGAGAMNQYGSVQDALTQNAATLPNLPASSAGAIAGAIQSAMACGQNPKTNNPANTFSVTGLSGASPVAGTAPPQVTLGSWWSDIEHDVKSVLHAISQGVAAVESVGSSFDTALGQWTMQLELKLANGVTSGFKYLIEDLQSACVAVMGVLSALGSDIATAISFLKTLVSDIVADAEAIADVLYPWIMVSDTSTTGLSYAVSELTAAKNNVDYAFADLQQQLASAMSAVRGTSAGAGPSAYAHQQQQSGGSGQVNGTSSNSKATWLLQKTRNLDSSSAVGTMLSASTVTSAKSTTTAAAATGLAGSVSSVLASAPKVSNPTEALSSITVDWLEQLLLACASDALSFVDTVVDDVIQLMIDGLTDISAVMTTSLTGTPIGDLLSMFKIGDLTLGKLVCLLIGFGMAIAGDVIFAGQQWLPATVSSARTTRSAPAPTTRLTEPSRTWGDFLDIANAVVALYSIGPTVAADNEYYTQDPEPSKWLAIINIGFEAVINVVAFPFAAVGDPQLEFTPRSNKLVTTTVTVLCWVWGLVPMIVDIAAEALEDDENVPAQVVNNNQAVVSLVFGVLLVIFNIAVAAVTDPTDPIPIMIGFFAWAPLAFKIARFGGPQNDGVCFVSFAADLLGPIGVMALSVAALAS